MQKQHSCYNSRHITNLVDIDGVKMGGNSPILIQSMTNTDTADVEATTNQINELYMAGSEAVRITVNNLESAQAVSRIKDNLLKKNINVPIIGCFHYNGHQLLSDVPDCAQALSKYRINPGNVGFGQKKDNQFAMMIETAIKYNKAVRIGVNWGSLDQELSKQLMDDNSKSSNPKSSSEVLQEALILSTLNSAKFAEDIGLAANKIVVSCKVSRIQELVNIYRELAKRSNYALHLGLTEAGIGTKGIVSSTAALAILISEGIGDTIRVSLTPKPGESRTKEVEVCQELLQTMGIRYFNPLVTACPGCGRTTSSYFQGLADNIQNYLKKQMPIWKGKYNGVANMNVAVMGCIVNGPGESKHADIGISLPGTGESPVAPVFIDGKKTHTLRGDNIDKEFIDIIENYVSNKYI